MRLWRGQRRAAFRRPQRETSYSTSDVEARLFRKHDRAFLYDPRTCTSFALDAAGETAVRILLGAESIARPVDTPAVRAAFSELVRLRQRGYFRHREIQMPSLASPCVHSVYTVLSRRCNLRCHYCYTRLVDHESEMAPETMGATAQFAAELAEALRLDGRIRGPGVDISSAGEITCQLELYDRFSGILQTEGSRRGLHLVPYVWFGSNLTTLCRPAVESRLEELGIFSCSLDGPPEAHDLMRVYPDGRGSYADARRGLEKLNALGQRYNLGAVLTSAYPDVLSIYQHLFDLAAGSVGVKPVRADPAQSYAIGQNLAAICDGYDRFADWLLGLPEANILRCLQRIFRPPVVGDYFGRFLHRVIGRLALYRRCNAWISEITVDTDGALYACAAMPGIPEARIGSVWDGIDEAKMAAMAEQLQVTRREPCKDCWARFLCGGGCMHHSYLTFGEFGPPDPAECALNKHLIELAIWFYAELKEKRPAVAAQFEKAASPDH